MPGLRRPRRPTLLALTAALAAAAAVVGGWTLSAAPDAPSTPAVTRPHALPPVTERLFSWTDVDYRSAEAQRRYAIACMARQDFRYAPPATPRPGTGSDQRPQPFGQEPAAAPDGTPAPPPTEKPPVPSGPETTKAYGQALFGDEKKRVSAKGSGRMKVSRPGNGCLAEAETKVLGDGRMRWLQVRITLFEAQEEARVNLEKDQAFRALNDRWRACMKEAGFRDRTDPARLLASLRTVDARRADASLAADLRCKESTGYLDTAYARLAAVQQRWLDAHPDVDRDWTALLRRQDEATRPTAP